ncbi:MAG: hypothetical protein ABI561_02590 [Bradyrhizobium sp.]
MKLVKAAIVATLAITTISVFASPGEAAPLPTNVAAVKAALDAPVLQVRYGRWAGGGGWGHRGWGGGYRGLGYGGYRGYRGLGWGAAAAGAVVGGAIARSAYYGGYYGDGYGYGGGGYGYGGGYGGDYGYASDYCPPGHGGYYSGYSARRHYNGW